MRSTGCSLKTAETMPDATDDTFVRIATDADVDRVRACVDAAFTPFAIRIGRAPTPMLADYKALIGECRVFVAEREWAIAGVIVLLHETDTILVETLAVHPLHQRRGVGQCLMACAEAEACRAGKRRVRLYTNELMADNLIWYPKRGYVETDRREEDGRRRVFFAKVLDD